MQQNDSIIIPAHLTPFIKSTWASPSMDNRRKDTSYSIFADGSPGIVFQQSASGMFLGDKKKLSPVFLYGQTVEPLTLHAAQDNKMLVLILHPHVLKSLFRFDAKEVTDDCVDMRLVPSVPRINLTEQLWNTGSSEKKFELMFRYLSCLVEKHGIQPDGGVQYAASEIMKSNGNLSLKKLQSQLNVSERTFERKFAEHIGVSPKMLAAIARFQATLLQLKSDNFTRLSDLAYHNGFADQSHFIRVFKKFTGMLPLAFYRQATGQEQDAPFNLN